MPSEVCGETLKITNPPILIGFEWTYSLQFSTGSLANPAYVNLDLYDIFFAIKASTSSAITLVPTITKYSNGLAVYEFSALQTTTMSAGEWVGHSFLQLKSGGAPEFYTKLEICVVQPVPTP